MDFFRISAKSTFFEQLVESYGKTGVVGDVLKTGL